MRETPFPGPVLDAGCVMRGPTVLVNGLCSTNNASAVKSARIVRSAVPASCHAGFSLDASSVVCISEVCGCLLRSDGTGTVC